MFKKLLVLVFALLIVPFVNSAEARDRVILEITPVWVGTSPPNITKNVEGVTRVEFIVRTVKPNGQRFSARVTNSSGVVQNALPEVDTLGNNEFKIAFRIGNLPEAEVIFEDGATVWKFRVRPEQGNMLTSRTDIEPL